MKLAPLLPQSDGLLQYALHILPLDLHAFLRELQWKPSMATLGQIDWRADTDHTQAWVEVRCQCHQVSLVRAVAVQDDEERMYAIRCG